VTYPDKIELVLTYKHDTDDSELFTERVDAIRINDHYKLVHIPAFAHNLAYGDIVNVEFDDNEFHFDELIEESGHSTIHIVVFNLNNKESLVARLEQFDCAVNTHIADNYIVIDVPPNVLYETIKGYLQQEEDHENISFRESCLSKIHR
jgi:hypothetical protein